MVKYKRILLKLSGESLMGKNSYGIDEERLIEYSQQIKEISNLGVKVGIVIGGGNIFRGLSGIDKGFDRVKGDYMGMLATVINSIALQSAFESMEQKTRLFTSFEMSTIGEKVNQKKVEDAFENNEIVIFSGGTGNPFFTTDSASVLRGIEMKADILLKGTRVDGVYSEDPEKNKFAKKFEKISFEETYNMGLKIMDLTAFTMAKENNLNIIVFDVNKKGNLKKIINSEKIGTLIYN